MDLPSFLGVLESPLDTGLPWVGDSLPLRGWATHTDGPVDAVRVKCAGLAAPVALAAGLRRADAAAAFPERPHAMSSGFAGMLALPQLKDPVLPVEVEVLVAGRVVHVWRRTVHRESPDDAWRRWIAAGSTPSGKYCAASLPTITWLIWRKESESRQSAAETATWWAAIGGPGTEAHVVCGHRAAAATLEGSGSAYIGVVGVGDRPVPGLKPLLADALLEEPDLLVADHDHVNATGLRVDPVLKPGWHSALADHPEVAARAWLMHTRGRPAAETIAALYGADDLGPALLQAWSSARPTHSRTVAQIRGPMLSASTASAETAFAATPRPSRGTPDKCVAVIIPSCLSDPAMLAQALDGLFASADVQRLEVLVLLNNLRGHTVTDAREHLSRWPVRILHREGEFNWSALNNEGARATTAEHLLFLNDDVAPLERHWLPELQTRLAQPGVGAVGAVLRYPDGRLQHAGIQVHGQPELACRHLFRFCSGNEPQVRRWLAHDQLPVTAVTGACLLTPRSVFDAVGGFDERLALVYNDVDYCMRLRESGWSSIVAVRAELCHHEGWSRGGLAEDEDRARFTRRWHTRWPGSDPHGHPWLATDRDDWMPDFHRPARPAIEYREE